MGGGGTPDYKAGWGVGHQITLGAGNQRYQITWGGGGGGLEGPHITWRRAGHQITLHVGQRHPISWVGGGHQITCRGGYQIILWDLGRILDNVMGRGWNIPDYMVSGEDTRLFEGRGQDTR